MSSSEHDALLRAVIADPDNDLPRLVYADWCEENGDPSRAEFIRVQIGRAELDEYDGRHVGLEQRERTLLGRHGRRWRAELLEIDGVTWGHFERGFVTSATLYSASPLVGPAGVFGQIASAAPVSRLWLGRGADVKSADWAAIEPDARLRHFGIERVELEDIPALAAAPFLKTLRPLELECIHLGDADVTALAASPYLAGLGQLALSKTLLGDAGLRSLGQLQRLRRLRLNGVCTDDGVVPAVTADGLEWLADAPLLNNLVELDLGSQNIAGGLSALLASPRAARLKRLHLTSCDLTAADFDGFAAAHPDLRLELLDLANGADEESPDRWSGAAALADLRHLDLSGVRIHDAGAEALAGAAFAPSLRRLILRGGALHSGGVRALTAGGLTGLHTLDLSSNRIGVEGVEALAAWPGLATVRRLYLMWCSLGAAELEALAASPHAANLLSLDLGKNNIRGEELLESGLGHLDGLAEWGLSGNPIGDAGAAALVASGVLERLSRLELNHAGIGANALRPIRDAAERAPFELNDIGNTGSRASEDAD